MADNPKLKNADGDIFRPLTDEITTRNGSAIGTDSVQAQVVKLATGGDGVANDFDLTSLATQTTLAAVLAAVDGLEGKDYATQTTLAAIAASVDGLETLDAAIRDRLPAALQGGALSVRDAGTYGYASGTATGTVDVPSGARLKRVSVVAHASQATTVTIGGGATITIPAAGGFDEQIPGDAVGADVVIGGGAPQSFYVSWVA